jgi:glycosyltransferase involved in cell wall biosynthesis
MKVSIGIPFYNPGKFFRESIASILNQTFTDFELILLDDGSSDNSLEVANSFDDSRIRVISDGTNKGLPNRLNELIDLSQGEYIARMDADDLVSIHRIAQQVELLNKTPDVDVIATGLCSITNNNEVIGYRLPGQEKRMSLPVVDAIFGRADIGHATILVRKSWYVRNRYNENARLMEDFQLWIDASAKNDLKVAFIKSPLYFYREESSVTPKKAIKAYFNGYKLIFTRYFKYLSICNKVKITFLTFIKIAVTAIASLLKLSDKLLSLRNTSTEQRLDVLQKLQAEVDSFGTHVNGYISFHASANAEDKVN